MWRAASIASTVYSKVGQIQLQSDDQVTRPSNGFLEANINLTNNTIEVQSGDVVGYYHPPDARYQLPTIQTDGYRLYRFSGSPESVDLSNSISANNERQPLIQYTIGKSTCNQVNCLNIF